MRRRGVIIGALVLVVCGAGAIWYLFLRGDQPPPVTLDEAVAAATSTTTGAGITTTTPDTTATEATAPASTAADPSTGADLGGDWGIDQASSFAGYRIAEELAGIGASEAVGRTSGVTGALSISGATVTDVAVEVDMTTLDSGDSRRDGALATRGLETGAFPTAGFQLTEPIDLGAVPEPGTTVSATATGELTLHGVANPVEMPIEGQLVDDSTLVVVGSVPVTLTDYGIEPPTGFAVLSIEDTGTIELQLTFTR